MKKFLLSSGLVLTFIVYALLLRNHKSDDAVVTPPAGLVVASVEPSTAPSFQDSPLPDSPSPLPSPLPSPTLAAVIASPAIKPSPKPSPIPSPSPKSTGQYKNGTYTGSTADAYYGNIQVKAIISGGKITDVQFLQYPSDRRNSIAINTQAMPYLKSEAIQIQGSQVDIVSGATDSSLAFRQSLHSALQQAL